MSYNRRITVLYGVRLPQFSREQWEEKLNDFLSTDFGLNSGIVGNCAELTANCFMNISSTGIYLSVANFSTAIFSEKKF